MDGGARDSTDASMNDIWNQPTEEAIAQRDQYQEQKQWASNDPINVCEIEDPINVCEIEDESAFPEMKIETPSPAASFQTPSSTRVTRSASRGKSGNQTLARPWRNKTHEKQPSKDPIDLSDSPAKSQSAFPGVNTHIEPPSSAASSQTPQKDGASQTESRRKTGLRLTKQNNQKRKGNKITPGSSLQGLRRGNVGLTQFLSEPGRSPETDDIEEFSDDRPVPPRKRTKSTEADTDGSYEFPKTRERKERTNQKNNVAKGAPVTRRKSPRLTRMTSMEEPISIEDDSESENVSAAQKKRRNLVCDVVRIAIGEDIFSSECKCSFKNSRLVLEFKKGKRGRTEEKLTLDLANLREAKYFLADDENENTPPNLDVGVDDNDQMTLLVLRVEPAKENGLRNYTKYSSKGTDPSRRYIAIEFRSDKEMLELIETMRKIPLVCCFVTDESKIELKDVPTYAQALVADSKKERKKRLSQLGSPKSSTKRNGFLAGKKEDDILLVYPFGADKTEIENAAVGLTEASTSAPPRPQGFLLPDSQDEGSLPPEVVKSRNRAHYLTVRVADYERLYAGVFLNDTLIDFWLQWIWRHEEDKVKSSVHFFTSHFFTTLSEDGPAGVESWTRKKDIDVFKKKMIFIPINESLHWSLCVLINPGCIENPVGDGDNLAPCMLFLDSLKAHRKKKVATLARKWLNSEWKRLGKGGQPFTSTSYKIFDPKIPYQDNGCDCGVFVCRYAYSMYQLRDRRFTFSDTRNEGPAKPFKEAITEDEQFAFGMADIARMRRELMTLIEKLSQLYVPWRAQQDKIEKEERRAAKRAAKKAKTAAAAAAAAADTSKEIKEQNITHEDPGRVAVSKQPSVDASDSPVAATETDTSAAISGQIIPQIAAVAAAAAGTTEEITEQKIISEDPGSIAVSKQPSVDASDSPVATIETDASAAFSSQIALNHLVSCTSHKIDTDGGDQMEIDCPRPSFCETEPTALPTMDTVAAETNIDISEQQDRISGEQDGPFRGDMETKTDLLGRPTGETPIKQEEDAPMDMDIEREPSPAVAVPIKEEDREDDLFPDFAMQTEAGTDQNDPMNTDESDWEYSQIPTARSQSDEV